MIFDSKTLFSNYSRFCIRYFLEALECRSGGESYPITGNVLDILLEEVMKTFVFHL